MTVIADSSFVYALYNAADSFHQEAMDFVEQRGESLLVPDVVLPEVCYLFSRDLGYHGMLRFLEYFSRIEARLEPVAKDDLERVHSIATTYADARLDIVDCCIMALAERLHITRIATFDRRDFSIFRPRHCRFFELAP